MKVTRQLSCLGLIIALAGLVALFAWVKFRFSTPELVLVNAGQVQDYAVGQEPRFFTDSAEAFYVLNVEGELIALVARSEKHIIRCTVKWHTDFGAFIDPCLGTYFSPRGDYMGKGPPGKLHQLPLQVQDGQVWVEIGYP